MCDALHVIRSWDVSGKITHCDVRLLLSAHACATYEWQRSANASDVNVLGLDTCPAGAQRAVDMCHGPCVCMFKP